MFSTVTVVFSKELPFLEIQARSMDLYLSEISLDSIIVVVNDSQSSVQIDKSWYGKHQNRVKIFYIDELVSADVIRTIHQERIDGWSSQQLCKLLGASLSTTDWSMVLDAKTWFIQSLDINKLISNNKAVTGLVTVNDVFVHEINCVSDFFGVSLEKQILSPSGVPFLFHTKTISAMIKEIGGDINAFSDFFLKHLKCPRRFTEFIFYCGYVLHKYKSYSEIYDLSNPYPYFYYNIADWEGPMFDDIFNNISLHETNILTVSLHRKTFPILTDQQQTRWLNFIKSKNLIDDTEYTKITLNTVLSS